MIQRIMGLVLLISSIALAQAGPSVTQHFKPGDQLHYYVRFDGNPELNKVFVQFRLQTPIKNNQTGFQTAFDVINSFTKISPGVYEVNGIVPASVASGSYRLIYVFANHDPQQKEYTYQQDFNDNIEIDIVNEPGFEFPKIKSVSPNPPK